MRASVKLTDLQKADVLLHALQHVPIKGCHTVIESAVQALLQVPDLPSGNVARALLLRAKGRFDAGHYTSANKDLHSALIMDPENKDIEATMQSQHVSTQPQSSSFEEVQKDTDSPPHLPEEIWMQIALFLPRRDLRSLLLVSNLLSRISSQLLSREINLHLTTAMGPGEDLGTFAPTTEEDVNQDTIAWHNQRSADILSRILVDSHFAGQIRTLSIFAISSDVEPHLEFEFKVGMLMNALSKLFNLCKVHCSGSQQLISRVLKVVHVNSSHLQRLSLVTEKSDDNSDVKIPLFKHLTHFSIRSDGGGNSSVHTVLYQSRDSLRHISIKNSSWQFPAQVISVRHLIRLEFKGCFLQEAISAILNNGNQLESLMLSGEIQSPASSLIRQHHNALPFLRHFSLTITNTISDPDFCPAISYLLRGRARLKTYHLFVSQTHASLVGFDSSAWAFLPALSGLHNLSITYPKDLPPELAGWLIPRTVRALTLEFCSTDNRAIMAFMIQLRKGMPRLLRYIGISDVRFRGPVRNLVEQGRGVPQVRVIRVNGTIWTVSRSNSGKKVLRLEVEPWPCRRTQYHVAEWLESLGCGDAIWRGVGE